MEAKRTKIIGIIGGAGVAATNKLNELLEIELTKKGAFRDAHHPQILTFQATQAPSRSLYLEGRGEDFTQDYIEVGKRLQDFGAQTLCMCCNTAHYSFDAISKALPKVKFLNLIESAVLKVKQSGAKSVGLIASDGCLKGRVYERYFEKLCPKVKIIYPNAEFQKRVTQGICNIKNIHRFDNAKSLERPKNIFKQVREHLLSGGGDIILLGCTDIRVDYYNACDICSLEVLKDLILKEVWNE
ncbi:amino acid racemase [Helicobacter sp. MIT 21-1697]|uniref:aspartate/glutamate racemase family protein n=1 Tax=Helicobacter sp. MIT 21-1697 TaxID=2993733 RepID=UPI00224B59DF|nr:amino acid racemase [Helicobacter sp. MIT 21-1697]MCX2716487.1 amino acid racemase [Helicobacter sp. MIT 21-1697]